MALVIAASVLHVSLGLFLSVLFAPLREGFLRLMAPVQIILGIIAAVGAYRVGEDDPTGAPIVAILSAVALSVSFLAGFQLPFILTAACLVPAVLDLLGTAFSQMDRLENTAFVPMPRKQ